MTAAFFELTEATVRSGLGRRELALRAASLA
jgi:hypothetical protein